MSVVISGALIDGAGIPMSGCHIILKSRVNTSEVVMRTVADVVTGNCGEYCFKAQTGKYCVYLKQDWRDEYCVGDIAVYDDSKPGTLNDFLTALDEGDLKPDVVKRFEELVAQAQQSAEAAAESERLAEQHVTDAQQIKSDCETLANDVQKNAEAVAASKQQVEQLASQVEDTAEEVRQDAEAAKKAASDAEQARDDIDVALSATLKTANHLSEIAAGGGDAQRESRDNLGLKSAATMDVQTGIYDRTEGRLAIPGMFGFGKAFSSGDRIEFKAESHFLRWVKMAKPGRYAVYAGTDVVIQGVLFSGVVEIIWPTPNSYPTDGKVDKVVIFYGINGHIYHNRYVASSDGGFLVGWENVKFSLTAKDVALWLSKYTYPAYEPDIGALVQAAYNPTSNPGNLPLKYGINYSGSYLHPYVFSAPVNGGSAEIHITEDKFLSGTYRGLVNYPELQTEDYMLGLFVRFA
ncbi:prophage tail fiber N-terminal domain-containing protein [Escherichia coli]|uniref:prophage tail fiber N-terminal domain-containing protein n=1 Tax=Escherichia coli TaxID=562 RepID=UPI001FF375E0|nr:prophage tail fiber N-terminal domain-containing protein [Escherichia coli]MBZ8720600.1 prophage tail fiber N-terminal domain-containing protein [Escherichia coli]